MKVIEQDGLGSRETKRLSNNDQIIADDRSHKATNILQQEEKLYNIFVNSHPKELFDPDYIHLTRAIAQFRKQFRAMLMEMIKGTEFVNFETFSLDPEQSESFKLTTNACLEYLLIGLGELSLTFSHLMELYEGNLPSHIKEIRELLQATLIFAQRYVAIFFSQDQMDFLFPLMQQHHAYHSVLPGFWDVQLKRSTGMIPDTKFDRILRRFISIGIDEDNISEFDHRCYVFNSIKGYTVYIDRNNQLPITKLQSLFSKALKWKEYTNKQACYERLLLDTTRLPPALLNIIIDYHDPLPSIDTLLSILNKNYQNPKMGVLLPFEIVSPYYTRLLIVKKNKVPLLFDFSQSKLSIMFNITKVLAALVKGDLKIKSLIDYFLKNKVTFSDSNSQKLKKLVEGILLHAETHVGVDLNETFYKNISELNKQLTLPKLDEKSPLKKQDLFQCQLNKLFSSQEEPSPISFIVVDKEGVRLYVEADKKQFISYLKSLKQQSIQPYQSLNHYLMFNQSKPSTTVEPGRTISPDTTYAYSSI